MSPFDPLSFTAREFAISAERKILTEETEFYSAVAARFSVHKYCEQFNVRQANLKSDRSRKSAEQYVAYLYRNEVPNHPKKYEAETFRAILYEIDAFVQNDRLSIPVFVPQMSLRSFVLSILRREPRFIKRAYKGVSYNPFLRIRGERLDNLDFFSWAACVQKNIPDFKLLVYDASLYHAINLLAEEPLFPGGDVSEWFYGLLEKTKDRDPEFAENCGLRKRYLKAMIDITGINAKYLSAEDILGVYGKELSEAFGQALEVCGALPELDRPIRPKDFVTYRRYGTEFSKSYTPAVVAEAFLFQKIWGANAKLGPTSELGFDNLIHRAMIARSLPYVFFWYGRASDESASIYFNDSIREIRRKLESASYRKVVETITQPFSSMPVEEAIVELVQKINKAI